MQTIICIPGLGGRANLFDKYEAVFTDFKLEAVDVINWREAIENICTLVQKEDKVILLCSCYAVHLALRVIDRYPEKVTHLVLIEPFFGEFLHFRKIQLATCQVLLAIIKFGDKLGIGRRKFIKVDYNFVEQQPMMLQPFYDLAHQSFRDYFEKLKDIGSFQMPERVETPTLFILSPKGFVHTKKRRDRLQSVFVHSAITEVKKDTHFIMTTSPGEIAEATRTWLKKIA